jgi:hypothetical protein
MWRTRSDGHVRHVRQGNGALAVDSAFAASGPSDRASKAELRENDEPSSPLDALVVDDEADKHCPWSEHQPR